MWGSVQQQLQQAVWCAQPQCMAQAGVLVTGCALHFAKGFGKARGNEGGAKRRKAKSGKIIPCVDCAGSGERVCQFCEGTKRMLGFLGERVPCVPCEASGSLGLKCKNCKGDGFFIS